MQSLNIQKFNKYSAIFVALVVVFFVSVVNVKAQSFYSTPSYSTGSSYSTPSYSSGSSYRTPSYSTGSSYSTPSYSTGSSYSTPSYSSGSSYRTPSYSSGTSLSYTSGASVPGYSYTNTNNSSGYTTQTTVEDTYVYETYGGYSGGNNGYYTVAYNNNGYGGCSGSNCGGGCINDCGGNSGCTSNCGGNNGCTSNCEEEVDPLTVSCFAPDSSIEEDETASFRANPSGGNGNYTYSWSGDVSGSGRTISKTFTTEGRKTATVTVRSGNQTRSATCYVTVVDSNEDLTGSCEANDSEIEEGESVTWRVTANGGNGNYTYSWSGDVSGSNRTETEEYNSTGTKRATVKITSDGESITRTCTVRVVDKDEDNDNLRATCDATPDDPEEGDTVTWKVKVTGGDGDYEYRWSGDVTGDERTETKRYNTSGRKEATVRITSDGQTLRKTCSVYVDNEDNSNRNSSSNVTLFQDTTSTPPAGTLSSGVFLSDLPYTGVSKNVKIALFFFGLLLWSAVVAYIFFKKQEEKNGKKLTHKEMIERFKQQNLANRNNA